MAKTKAVTVDGNRICIDCTTPKPLDQFPEFKRRGKVYRAGQCFDCRAAYHREYQWDGAKALMAEKQRIVNELKQSPCLDCGERFPSVCMDFDHVRGEKRIGIAKMVVQTFSVENLLEEIAKCELVCSNCHRIRTHRNDGEEHRARVRAGHARRAMQVEA